MRRVGEVREFPRLSAREVFLWINAWLRDHKLRTDADAVDALIALVGTALRQVTMELEKLVAYVGARSSITVRDVEATVSRLAESTIFTLVDAIGEQRVDAVLRALEEILREEAPPYVLFMIARQFRMLLRTSTLLARRTTVPMLRQALGVPRFVARRYAEQAQNFPVNIFPAIFARLQEADYAVKTTGLPKLALETLIVSLCVGGSPNGENERQKSIAVSYWPCTSPATPWLIRLLPGRPDPPERPATARAGGGPTGVGHGIQIGRIPARRRDEQRRGRTRLVIARLCPDNRGLALQPDGFATVGIIVEGHLGPLSVFRVKDRVQGLGTFASLLHTIDQMSGSGSSPCAKDNHVSLQFEIPIGIFRGGGLPHPDQFLWNSGILFRSAPENQRAEGEQDEELSGFH
jgi:hypothetical protein